MRALAFFVQLLLVLLIIRIVVRGIAGLFVRSSAPPRREAGRDRPRPQAPRQIEDLVLDRICQTHFPRSSAVRARIAGREELFCSQTCRDKALAEEARAS